MPNQKALFYLINHSGQQSNIKIAIPVTGHGGPLGCETWKLPHFLGNRLTDGGEVVSLTCWPPFTLRKNPGTHICQRLSQPQGHSVAGRIGSIGKSNGLIRNRTRDLLACSIVPQPTTPRRAPIKTMFQIKVIQFNEVHNLHYVLYYNL
jgi:hypothetical protein